jgi:hypothetical protein
MPVQEGLAAHEDRMKELWSDAAAAVALRFSGLRRTGTGERT